MHFKLLHFFCSFQIVGFRINPVVWSFTIVPSQDIQCQSRKNPTWHAKDSFLWKTCTVFIFHYRKDSSEGFRFKKSNNKKNLKNKKFNFRSWKLPDLKRLKVLYKRWAKIFVKTRGESKDGKKCGIREVPQDKTQLWPRLDETRSKHGMFHQCIQTFSQ